MSVTRVVLSLLAITALVMACWFVFSVIAITVQNVFSGIFH